MQQGTVIWQICVLLAAVLVVGYKAWRGWRAGVMRELINLVALACGYLMAIFGGRILAPALRPLGVPDSLLGIVGGALLGVLVFLAITVSGTILFKKTSQQSVAAVRISYGLAGGLIGGLMGLFMVWIAVLGIRLLGTVAETRIEAAKHPVNTIRGKPTPKPVPQMPGPWVRRLANIKHALEQGTRSTDFSRTRV
jgi:Colicin V production protein